MRHEAHDGDGRVGVRCRRDGMVSHPKNVFTVQGGRRLGGACLGVCTRCGVVFREDGHDVAAETTSSAVMLAREKLARKV